MKKLLFCIIAGLALQTNFACKDPDASDMTQINAVRDSIFKVYPTVGSILIKVEDRTSVKVILGDSHLYTATVQHRQEEAQEIGKIVLHAFGKDTYLDKGVLLVTQNERNSEEAPADALSTPIDIKVLKGK